VCTCGHVDFKEKIEVEDPRALKAFTYIPASLPADPKVAHELLVGYGKELMQSLLRVAAYVMLSRRNFKRKVFLFTGVTSSGKTSFCELLRLALNHDCQFFAANALTARGDATHAVRASIATHKLAVFSELPPAAISKDNFKMLTDPTLAGRFLFQNPADFVNLSNIIITSNYMIDSNSIDAAVVERLVILQFSRMFHNNEDVAKFYIADEKNSAVEDFAQILWRNTDFRNSFLAAVLQAWQDLCKENFKFQVDEASSKQQHWFTNEVLSVDAFSQLLEIDTYEYYPTIILFDLYRKYCDKIGVVGVTELQRFSVKLSETAIGRMGKKKLLRKNQFAKSAVVFAEKFGIKLLDDDNSSDANEDRNKNKKRWCYPLKPSQKLLKLLGIDLSDDNNPQPPMGMFEDDTEEQDEKEVDTEQFLNEAFPTTENDKNEETSTFTQIPQNCTNCGNELIVKNKQLICEHCNATIYFYENTIVEVDEDRIPQRCIICGNPIDLNNDNECKNCKIIYRVRFNFPF